MRSYIYIYLYLYKKWCCNCKCYTGYIPNVLPELDKRHVVDKTYYIEIGGLDQPSSFEVWLRGEGGGESSRFGFGFWILGILLVVLCNTIILSQFQK